MPSPELERLADRGHLKREPPVRAEVEGLIRSGVARLGDAQKADLSPDGRFDLAYGAAHALALAALRLKGYRTDKRYLVFRVLPHTVGTPAEATRLLAKGYGEGKPMTWRISNDAGMQQTLEALGDLYASHAALRRRVEPRNPRNFAILAEGHVDHIRRLQRQLDEYAGVSKVRPQVPRTSRRKLVAKRSRRQAAAR